MPHPKQGCIFGDPGEGSAPAPRTSRAASPPAAPQSSRFFFHTNLLFDSVSKLRRDRRGVSSVGEKKSVGNGERGLHPIFGDAGAKPRRSRARVRARARLGRWGLCPRQLGRWGLRPRQGLRILKKGPGDLFLKRSSGFLPTGFLSSGLLGRIFVFEGYGAKKKACACDDGGCFDLVFGWVFVPNFSLARSAGD